MPTTRKRHQWSKYAPKSYQRTIMLQKCGKKCFLGPKKSFPICSKNTCKINKAGVHAAYVRAKQYKHNTISRKALKLLHKFI